MAGITLAQAEARLQEMLDAHTAVSTGQSYEIGGPGATRRLTRANLEEIMKAIDFWDAKVKQLASESSASGAARAVVMRPGW